MQERSIVILVLALALALLCACSSAQTPAVPADGASASVSENTEAPASAPNQKPEPKPVSDRIQILPSSQNSEPEASPEPEPDRVQAFGTEPVQSDGLRAPERVLISEKYTAEVYVSTTERDGSQIESREYCVSDGVTASTYRATGSGDCVFFDQEVTEAGALWYYSFESGEWICETLAEGSFSSPVVVVELDSGTTYFFALPRTVVLRENDSMEYLPEQDGALNITQTEEGLQLTVTGHGLAEERVSDALILTSPDKIMNWDVNNCAKAWVSYVTNDSMLWCYGGYYRESPYNYIPTGTNYYYCCPACYCIRGFLGRTPPCKEAPALTILMLDTMAQRQNSYGYWATEPGSGWLQGDYGIGAGFYDTRFNTELLELYIRAAQKFGGNMFEDAIDHYLAFYTQYADTNHIATENGGWLIPDYWHPDEHTTPHISLNHQISECLALYHAAELLDREALFALADRMLLAIEDTGSGWVMPDHNLYYSIKPDGTYVEGDYPYLTYNDLLHLRDYLDGIGRTDTQTLTDLMGEKLQWMTNNGVTGYEKS